LDGAIDVVGSDQLANLLEEGFGVDRSFAEKINDPLYDDRDRDGRAEQVQVHERSTTFEEFSESLHVPPPRRPRRARVAYSDAAGALVEENVAPVSYPSGLPCQAPNRNRPDGFVSRSGRFGEGGARLRDVRGGPVRTAIGRAGAAGQAHRDPGAQRV